MKARPSYRSAFTLVEMLVVVIIIGILMAMISAAVMSAITAARVFTTFREENQMQQAIQGFMTSHGTTVYPPCDLRMPAGAADTNAPVYKYFRKLFPRYDITQLQQNLADAGIDTSSTGFDPGQALVFWLVGFDPDPEHPLNNHLARMNGSDIKFQLYPFDPNRLKVGVAGHYVYLFTGETAWDDTVTINGAVDAGEKYRAYLYYDNNALDNGDTYRYYTNYTNFTGAVTYAGFAPYRSGTTASPSYFFGRDTCQIICAGKDQYLGVGGIPTGAVNSATAKAPYTGYDADNIANFGEGSTMRDFIEKKKP